jgi:hypothetical protein
MTIHLSSSLQIHVPNDQFLTPFVDIARNGSHTFNYSQRELLFNGVANQPATLGRYFLTSAYLMVNHDANTFTLWKANPSSSTQLVSVMSEKTAKSCNNVTGVVQPSAAASSTTSATSVSNSGQGESAGGVGGSRGLSTGVIAGIAVGGLVVIIGILVPVIMLVRIWRGKNSQADQSARKQMEGEENPELDGIPGLVEHMKKYQITPPTELNSTQVVNELQGMTLSRAVANYVELDASEV